MTRWENFFYGAVAVALIMTVSACSTGKALFDACRDGLCR